MNHEIRIRRFSPADEPAVVDLWTRVFGYSAPHNEPRSVIREKLAADPELLFVAAIDETVVGTVMGGYDGHRGWIYSLAVEPRFRRQGIAVSLMRHVEAALADRGCRKVNLQIFGTNAEVVRFYERMGYKVEERISMGRLLTAPSTAPEATTSGA